jgi:hypothetical protein
VPPSGTPVPPSGLPDPLEPHGPQTPRALPTGATQVVPAQQSAVVVHAPHAPMH